MKHIVQGQKPQHCWIRFEIAFHEYESKYHFNNGKGNLLKLDANTMQYEFYVK